MNLYKTNDSYEKLVKCQKNSEYTPGNLLDYWYHQICYKLIHIDLSRQSSPHPPAKINFLGKFNGRWWCSNVFYCCKAAKHYSKLFFRFITCNKIIQTIKYHKTYKVLNLLNEASNSRFVTINWNISDQPNIGNETIYNTEVLTANRCCFNDAYILVRGDITVVAAEQLGTIYSL